MPQQSTRNALRRPLRTLAVGAGSVVFALGLTGCLDSADAARERAAAASASASEGGLPSPSPTQDAERRQDVTFASAMLKNQRQAVEYSQLLLDKGDGVDEEARRFAGAVADRRPALVDRLTGLLEGWGVDTEEAEAVASANPTPTSGGFATGPSEEELMEMNKQAAEDRRAGLLTSEEKRALEAATDEDAGRVYLLQMHRLHFGSLMIADTQVEEGDDEEATQLAEEIAEDQRRVIDDLQKLLGEMGAIVGGSRDHEPNPKNAPESINNDDGPVTFRPDPPSASPSSDEDDESDEDSDEPSPSPSPADTNAPSGDTGRDGDGNGGDGNDGDGDDRDAQDDASPSDRGDGDRDAEPTDSQDAEPTADENAGNDD